MGAFLSRRRSRHSATDAALASIREVFPSLVTAALLTPSGAVVREYSTTSPPTFLSVANAAAAVRLAGAATAFGRALGPAATPVVHLRLPSSASLSLYAVADSGHFLVVTCAAQDSDSSALGDITIAPYLTRIAEAASLVPHPDASAHQE
jgi:Ca2+-binding RTX toxin-like protein